MPGGYLVLASVRQASKIKQKENIVIFGCGYFGPLFPGGSGWPGRGRVFSAGGVAPDH